MARPLLVSLLALAACGAPEEPIGAVSPPPGPPPAPEPAAAVGDAPLAAPAQPAAHATSRSPLQREMHQQLLRAVEIKEAVIAGELADVHRPARALAEQALAVPDAWKPYVEAMQADARAVLAARDIPTAAQATAGLARRCGACHQANGARPDLSFSPAPAQAPGVASAMLRHQWAADRLYQGLIGPSSAAWEAGASVMADAPLHARELAGDVELPEALHGLAKRVHDLGVAADTAATADAQAKIYGDLLGTCAACHKGGC